MTVASDLRLGRTCVCHLHVHLVFWSIHPLVFSEDRVEQLRLIFGKVCTDFGGVFREIEGGRGHVRLMVEYPATIALSKLVNSLKGVSSRMLKKRLPDMECFYWEGAFWSPGYFAASFGGPSSDKVTEYIDQNQRADFISHGDAVDSGVCMSDQLVSEGNDVAVEHVKPKIVVLEDGHDIDAAISAAGCWCTCSLVCAVS